MILLYKCIQTGSRTRRYKQKTSQISVISHTHMVEYVTINIQLPRPWAVLRRLTPCHSALDKSGWSTCHR